MEHFSRRRNHRENRRSQVAGAGSRKFAAPGSTKHFPAGGKTEELAKESLQDQQKAFDAGMGTSLAVVDAQLSLSRLRLATLKANYEAVMSLVGLLETCGEVEKISQYLENRK